MRLILAFFLSVPFIGMQPTKVFGNDSLIAFDSVDHLHQVTLAPMPGLTDMFYMKVKASGHLKSSIAVVKKIKDNSGANYHAWGKTWTYWLDDHNHQTLVNGTLINHWSLYHDDGKEEIALIPQKTVPADISLATLQKDYWQENALGPYNDVNAVAKAIDESLLAANQACGSSIKYEIDRKQTGSKEGVFADGSLKHFFVALADLCQRDKDYLKAIRSVKTVRTQNVQENGLSISNNGNVVTIKMGRDFHNPKFQYPKLIISAF